MAVSKEALSFREQRATLKNNQATNIYFGDTAPNYISISNPSASSLYMGVNGNISTTNYDITIPPYATKQWIKPNGTKVITIYNNSDDDLEITLQSWEGEFDPSAMSQSTEIVGGSTDGLLGIVTISNMLTELPEGNNVIGGVYLSEFASSLPTGNNVIGKVEIKPTPHTAKKVEVSTTDTNIKISSGIVYGLKNLILKDGMKEVWSGDYQSEHGIKCENSIIVQSIGEESGYIIFE